MEGKVEIREYDKKWVREKKGFCRMKEWVMIRRTNAD